MYILKNAIGEYFTGATFSNRQRDAKRFADTSLSLAIFDAPANVRYVKLTPRNRPTIDNSAPLSSEQRAGVDPIPQTITVDTSHD
jgi:predicted kinase